VKDVAASAAVASVATSIRSRLAAQRQPAAQQRGATGAA
jgi:hypothetical protein